MPTMHSSVEEPSDGDCIICMLPASGSCSDAADPVRCSLHTRLQPTFLIREKRFSSLYMS